ncbi:MAG: hypothetical protein QGI45_15215, partial [Myxococcota bacterium]|nr:hypothetical protein [Myxococcota bacterium]
MKINILGQEGTTSMVYEHIFRRCAFLILYKMSWGYEIRVEGESTHENEHLGAGGYDADGIRMCISTLCLPHTCTNLLLRLYNWY